MSHRLVLLAGLYAALPCVVQAQTWDAPIPLRRTSYATVSGNTCTHYNAIQYVEDFGVGIPSNDVTYSLTNGPSYYVNGRFPLFVQGFGHARVRLMPQGWDASLWLCRVHHTGGFLSQCIDASDNWGEYMVEEINVPHEQGTFRVVVDGSVFMPWNCGSYTLEVVRDYW